MNALPQTTRYAALFTGAFAIIGIFCVLRTTSALSFLLPCCLVYGLVLVNTYPSVRLFKSIEPSHDRVQRAIDLVLCVLYLCMALTLGHPISFTLSSTLMFALATLKYVHLATCIPYQELLHHKIFMDGLGTLGALIAFLGCMFWRPEIMLWLWAVGFTLAQIDVFFLHPLYVLPQRISR